MEYLNNKHFRMDNTEGYNQSQLNALNILVDASIKSQQPNDIDDTYYKHICETAQSNFDNRLV